MPPQKSIEIADGIRVPLLDYATQGNAILGIRDSGKTYTATGIAEKLVDGGIPFVAFDPIGVWRFLKIPASTRSGRGFPVVVAGDNADLPLQAETAADLVRAAMREGVSLVIDLYSLHLSKADWRRIVETSIRVLLYENSAFGPRHIILEEAAEFCPQVIEPEHRKVYSEIEKLARMGGNAGLGFTLVNQRAEQVNKAVLELCEGIVLHRQRGRLSITAIKKWMDLVMDGDDGGADEVTKSLPRLARGEAWVWMPGFPKPLQRQMPAKRSLHPDRRERHTQQSVHAATDVAPFVSRMNIRLSELAAKNKSAKLAPASGQATSNSAELSALRTQVADLQRQSATAEAPKEIEVPVLTAEIMAQLKKTAEDVTTAAEQISKVGQLIQGAIAAARKPVSAPPKPAVVKSYAQTPKPPVSAGNAPRAQGGADPRSGVGERAGVRRMMVALAQRPGLTARQVGVRAGLSAKSGTFRTYMGRLRSNGWVEWDGDEFRLSAAGWAALGEYTPLPQGRELIAYWKEAMLRRGEARMLDVLAEHYPQSVTEEELGRAAGIAHTSGTFRTYLGRLRTLDLIEGKAAALRLSAELAD